MAVVLPATSGEQAEQVAQRIVDGFRERLYQATFSANQLIKSI